MPKKIMVYQDDALTFYLEPNNDVVHVHCYVDDWKLSVMKRIYSLTSEILSFAKKEGFKYVVTVTPNPKFAKLFGGEVIDEIVINGIQHEVIVWEPD